MRSLRRWLMVAAMAAMVTACVNDAPDEGAPTESGAPAEQAPPPDSANEPDAAQFVVDWVNGSAITLDNGWSVQACEGDALMLCVADGSTHLGVVEMLAYRADLQAGSSRADYLQSRVDDMLAGMAADRAVGCPHLTFSALPVTAHVVDGLEAVRFGFRMVDDAGREAERLVLYFALDGTTHVTITAAAYAPDGCLERIGEFEPSVLQEFEPYLDRIVTATPLPPLEVDAPLAQLADGVHHARLLRLDAPVRVIDLHLAQVLSGDEALAAARAAGDIGPNDDLPNDVFVVDHPDQEYSLAVDQATIEVVDCRTGCQLVTVAVDDFLTGAVTALNGPYAVFEVEIAQGSVVRISEIYLP